MSSEVRSSGISTPLVPFLFSISEVLVTILNSLFFKMTFSILVAIVCPFLFWTF